MVTVFTTDQARGNYTEIESEDSLGDAIWTLTNGLVLCLKNIDNKKERIRTAKAIYKYLRSTAK